MLKHTSRHWPNTQWITVVLLVIFACISVGAKKGSQGAKSHRGGGGSDKPPTVDAPTLDSKPLESAQNDLTAARSEFNKAQDAFSDLVKKLRDAFDATGAMSAALADLKAAEVAYGAASKTVLAAIIAKPEHKAALNAKQRDQEKIAELREENGPAEQITALANDALKQGTAITNMENDAVAADPAASAAKAKLAAAGAKVGALRAQFDATLTKNSEWVAAKKALDDARSKLEAADAAEADAAQKFAHDKALHDAAAAKQEKLNQEHPTRKG